MRRILALIILGVLGLTALTPVAAGPLRDLLTRRAGGRLPALDDDDPGGMNGPITLPPGARVQKDVPYGPDPAQRMDVYLPAHAHAAPVIIMVHGGGWIRGDKAMSSVVQNKVARWLPKGWIVVSVNYRLVPKADPLTQAGDVAKALAVAQSKAASWGGDPARFVLMGHSAGAHLVALLAADPSLATRQGAKPWLGTVSLDSACLDVAQSMQGPHLGLYDRAFPNDPAYWHQASPQDRLTGTSGPILLVCSSYRRDSCEQARSFAAKSIRLGRRATVLPIAFTHREINQNLGLAGDYTKSVEAFLSTLGLS
jgi:arylformamidase